MISESALCEERSGKALSDCLAVNFAVGCTHGCLFCYVDRIHKMSQRVPSGARWGTYFYVKPGLEEAIRRTPWAKWRGREILMSATHDPYLPELYFPHKWPRKILEAGLRAGVRFRILTRSVLVRQDFDLLAQHRGQVFLMASIPTLDGELAKLTEPRAPPPELRLKTLAEAKALGLRVGVVVAPIIPVDGWRRRLEELFTALFELGPDVVYGEVLHARGENLRLLREVGIDVKPSAKLDREIGNYFEGLLAKFNLRGRYWYEYNQVFNVDGKHD